MTGFKLRTTGIGSDHYTNCATTTTIVGKSVVTLRLPMLHHLTIPAYYTFVSIWKEKSVESQFNVKPFLAIDIICLHCCNCPIEIRGNLKSRFVFLDTSLCQLCFASKFVESTSFPGNKVSRRNKFITVPNFFLQEVAFQLPPLFNKKFFNNHNSCSYA